MQKQRVQKFIQLSGLYSRRKAEELIQQGRVKVNGNKISLGDQCTQEDNITIDDKEISYQSSKTYILMNKPKGVVCSNDDPHNKETVFDIIKEDIKGLFSVGRLDKDTTGLLILTNDGDFSQKIIHPSSKIKKEYLVHLNKELQIQDKKAIEKGLTLDNQKLSPCSIKKLGDKYSIKINEGKKRQIRRIFEFKNYQVTNLHRIKIGKLDITKSGLIIGKYKKVSKEMLEKSTFL